MEAMRGSAFVSTDAPPVMSTSLFAARRYLSSSRPDLCQGMRSIARPSQATPVVGWAR